MDILVVVDMQKDFISGALGTKEALAIVPRVAEKIVQAKKRARPSSSPAIPITKIIWTHRRAKTFPYPTALKTPMAGRSTPRSIPQAQ